MYIGLYKTPNKALSCLLSCKQKKSSSLKSPDEGPPIPCTEMSSILYNVLKLKKASKFKTYFYHHCYIACFEMGLESPVMNPPKTPYEVM